MQEQEIILITIPFCPKCKIMKKRLSLLQEKYPDLKVEERGLQSYINEAFSKRIMDAPIILVNGKSFSGVVDESIIIEALGY